MKTDDILYYNLRIDKKTQKERNTNTLCQYNKDFHLGMRVTFEVSYIYYAY